MSSSVFSEIGESSSTMPLPPRSICEFESANTNALEIRKKKAINKVAVVKYFFFLNIKFILPFFSCPVEESNREYALGN
jgi:hypothetical protein